MKPGRKIGSARAQSDECDRIRLWTGRQIWGFILMEGAGMFWIQGSSKACRRISSINAGRYRETKGMRESRQTKAQSAGFFSAFACIVVRRRTLHKKDQWSITGESLSRGLDSKLIHCFSELKIVNLKTDLAISSSPSLTARWRAVSPLRSEARRRRSISTEHGASSNTKDKSVDK